MSQQWLTSTEMFTSGSSIWVGEGALPHIIFNFQVITLYNIPFLIGKLSRIMNMEAYFYVPRGLRSRRSHIDRNEEKHHEVECQK